MAHIGPQDQEGSLIAYARHVPESLVVENLALGVPDRVVGRFRTFPADAKLCCQGFSRWRRVLLRREDVAPPETVAHVAELLIFVQGRTRMRLPVSLF